MSAGSVEGERLNRFLARRGVASRRGADALIAAKRIAVNGIVAGVGTLVDGARDTVTVDGTAIPGAAPPLITLALNKPVGVVSTMADPQGRPTVAELAPSAAGLVPIGRLDADSRGLLLLTTDGELAHRVAHPRHGVRKTYRVRTAAAVADATLRRLEDGIELEDGLARILGHRRHGANPLEVEVVMGEGRKREVRRLLAAVGADVVDLCRVAVGPVLLGRLPEARTRPLTATELAELRAEVGLGQLQDAGEVPA